MCLFQSSLVITSDICARELNELIRDKLQKKKKKIGAVLTSLQVWIANLQKKADEVAVT